MWHHLCFTVKGRIRFQQLRTPPGLCGCSDPVATRQREQIFQRSILLSGFPISTTLKSYHLWHIGWAYKSLLGGIQSNKSLSTPSVLVGLVDVNDGRSQVATPGGAFTFLLPVCVVCRHGIIVFDKYAIKAVMDVVFQLCVWWYEGAVVILNAGRQIIM